MVRGLVAPEPATGGLWCCLYCREPLSSSERMLSCDACGRQYPVVAGIPLLVREPVNYFQAERAALLSAAREARRRRELLDGDGIYAGLPEPSRKRHRDVSETQEAQVEALLALIETPGLEPKPGDGGDGTQAMRPGWDFETMLPYLLRDWGDAPE